MTIGEDRIPWPVTPEEIRAYHRRLWGQVLLLVGVVVLVVACCVWAAT